jgi:hypothetical protein
VSAVTPPILFLSPTCPPHSGLDWVLEALTAGAAGLAEVDTGGSDRLSFSQPHADWRQLVDCSLDSHSGLHLTELVTS